MVLGFLSFFVLELLLLVSPFPLSGVAGVVPLAPSPAYETRQNAESAAKENASNRSRGVFTVMEVSYEITGFAMIS